MYRFGGLFVCLVYVVISVKANAVGRECFETVLFNEKCCNFNITVEEAAIIKECTESTVDSDPRSCDLEICFAQKAGYLLPNGTVDMKSVSTRIEEDYENYPDIKDIVMEKCVMADNLEIYGAPKMCHLKKLTNCIRLYSLLNCPQWEDSDHCSKVKDKITECESVYP